MNRIRPCGPLAKNIPQRIQSLDPRAVISLARFYPAPPAWAYPSLGSLPLGTGVYNRTSRQVWRRREFPLRLGRALRPEPALRARGSLFANGERNDGPVAGKGQDAGGARGSRHVMSIRKARPCAPLPDFSPKGAFFDNGQTLRRAWCQPRMAASRTASQFWTGEGRRVYKASSFAGQGPAHPSKA